MYKVSPAPDLERASSTEIIRYFLGELENISTALQLVEAGRALPVLYVAPARPRTAQLVFADGTEWNPGSGQGYYFWSGAAWIPLHT